MSVSDGGEILRGTTSIDLSKYMAYPVTLGALYQQVDFDQQDKEEKGLVVSAEMGLTNFARPASIYLQYDKTENLAGLDGNDSDQLYWVANICLKTTLLLMPISGKTLQI